MAAWVTGLRHSQNDVVYDIKSKLSATECTVCGDKSSGKHYGVVTCEGCKSFFKRSIRRNLAYSCRAFQSCPIDINHRNQCQFCRLKKCVKVGMRKDAVQKGRLPKSPLEGSMVDQLIGLNQQNHVNGLSQPPIVAPYTNVFVRNDNITRFHQHHHSAQSFNCNYPFNGTEGGNASEISTRLLFNAIEWARNVPFFSALPTADQIALLKSSWSELYILSTSQHCTAFQLNARNLVSSPDQGVMPTQRKRMHVDEQVNCTDTNIKALDELVEKFKHLQTDPAEFSCLKALVLFNPDSPGVGNPSLIESLQEKAQTALEDYLRQQTSANYSNRFGKLLLRLPALSLIRPTAIESLFFSRLVGNHTMDNLVGSMLLYGINNNSNVPIMNNGIQQSSNNTYNFNFNPNSNGLNGHQVNMNNQANMNTMGLFNGTYSNNNIPLNNMNSINGINNLPNNLHNAQFNGMHMFYQSNGTNNNGLNNNISTSNGNFNVGIVNSQMFLHKPGQQNSTGCERKDSQKPFVKTESPPR